MWFTGLGFSRQCTQNYTQLTGQLTSEVSSCWGLELRAAVSMVGKLIPMSLHITLVTRNSGTPRGHNSHPPPLSSLHLTFWPNPSIPPNNSGLSKAWEKLLIVRICKGKSLVLFLIMKPKVTSYRFPNYWTACREFKLWKWRRSWRIPTCNPRGKESECDIIIPLNMFYT